MTEHVRRVMPPSPARLSFSNSATVNVIVTVNRRLFTRNDVAISVGWSGVSPGFDQILSFDSTEHNILGRLGDYCCANSRSCISLARSSTALGGHYVVYRSTAGHYRVKPSAIEHGSVRFGSNVFNHCRKALRSSFVMTKSLRYGRNSSAS